MSKNTKHVFYTQNKISYLIILGIIKTKFLIKTDCTILNRGKIIQNEDITIINVDEFNLKYTLFFWRNWSKLKNKKELLENRLNLNISQFVFYNSNFTFWYNTYLMNHKNCKEHNFIEEGLSGYQTNKEAQLQAKNKFNTIFFKFKKALILLNHKFEHTIEPLLTVSRIKNCDKVFGLSDEVYEHHNIEVVTNVFSPYKIENEFDLLIAPSVLTAKYSSFIDLKDFYEVLNETFKIIHKKGYKNLLIKFHPRERQEIKDFVSQELSKFDDLSFEILDLDISIENICAYKEIKIVTDLSSLGFYCTQLGSKVYSYLPILMRKSKKFRNKNKHFPKRLKQSFIPLNLLPNNF